MTNAVLYFIHGWGCDGSIWHTWLPAINKSVPYQIFDRGYFGAEKNNISIKNTAAMNIVIAHSLGLHLLPPESFQRTDLLVLVSSFRYFHEQSLNGKLSEKSIRLMKQRLVQDPLALLKDFYLKCGLGSLKSSNLSYTGNPLSISSIDHQLLIDDLSMLDKHQIDHAQLQHIPQVILLHGLRDQIVNPEHSQLMHQLLPNSRLFINDQAEHALPITDAQWCMQIIEDKKMDFEKKIFYPTSASSPLPLPYSSIIANFDRRANSYNQTVAVHKFAASRLASRINRQFTLASPGSILEIGCGTGVLSQHLLSLFPGRMICFLDPAAGMLALCRKNFQANSDCEFIHSPIEDYLTNPKFSQTRHTLIASSFVLHWLFDLKLVLNQLLEKLAPAGQLFFSIPVAGSFPQWKNICHQLNMPFTGNQLPALEDITSAIDNSKASIDCEEYSCDIIFQNSLQFFQHMKMLGANTKKFISAGQLGAADFRRLLKAWDNQSPPVLGKSEDKIICTYKILEGTITRR